VADLLKETLALRYPRLLASGVDYNDIQLVLGRLTRFEDWCAEWARMAEAHEALGEAALREGRTLTAVRAFARAAIYYHTGQSVSFDDPAEKRRVQERQRDAYRKAAPHLRPPARQVEVPFDGITFTGNLRLPEGARPAPCVLLNPGADSTKEEFYTLEHEFLARGVATFAYDGPGQGLTWRAMKLRPDFEKPVGAVIDALAGIPQIDGARLGIWGRSFGGYAAPRAACFEGRLRACISIGGFYALQTIWDRLPVTVKDTLAFAMGAAGHAEARERALPHRAQRAGRGRAGRGVRAHPERGGRADRPRGVPRGQPRLRQHPLPGAAADGRLDGGAARGVLGSQRVRGGFAKPPFFASFI
jgi:hypothetical protein